MMTIHFEPIIKKKQAITYIDDTLIQAKRKQQMFTVIQEYNSLLQKTGLKAAPETTLCFLGKVKFLGHVIAAEGLPPVAKRVRDLHNLKSPKQKPRLKASLGLWNFTAATSRTSMSIADHFTNSQSRTQILVRAKNTKPTSKK